MLVRDRRRGSIQCVKRRVVRVPGAHEPSRRVPSIEVSFDLGPRQGQCSPEGSRRRPPPVNRRRDSDPSGRGINRIWVLPLSRVRQVSPSSVHRVPVGHFVCKNGSVSLHDTLLTRPGDGPRGPYLSHRLWTRNEPVEYRLDGRQTDPSLLSTETSHTLGSPVHLPGGQDAQTPEK